MLHLSAGFLKSNLRVFKTCKNLFTNKNQYHMSRVGVLVWIRSKICTDQAAFTRQNSSKQICGWILMRETTADALYHWRKSYYGLWLYGIWVKNVLCWICFSFCFLQMLTEGLEWCGLLVMFLSAVWTLILTAPIHCRASIDETLMQWHISLMNNNTDESFIIDRGPQNQKSSQLCKHLTEVNGNDNKYNFCVLIWSNSKRT